MDAHVRLSEWWLQTGNEVPAGPAPDGTIDALCRRYDLSLPVDFRAYLSFSSPKWENWDDNMGNWWPVERIRNAPDEYSHRLDPPLPNEGRKCLFFLDYCIWCWAWAISCEEGASFGNVFLIGGPGASAVANSFTEFVDLYITNWNTISSRNP